MSIRKFSIEYERAIYGPYPKKGIEEIPNISVEIEKLNMFRDKVTFTVNNEKEEDFYAIVYELGCLAQSFIDAELNK